MRNEKADSSCFGKKGIFLVLVLVLEFFESEDEDEDDEIYLRTACLTDAIPP